ncbi:hypothetical protein Tco_1540142 [Tanacetum coccineum]
MNLSPTSATRSSTNELFTPYKEPEREFRSSRRHFKTLSLDEYEIPYFNLLSNQEYLEEEVAETMAKHGAEQEARPKLTMDRGLRIPTRQILDSRGAISSKIVADAKIAIQEMAEYS